MPYHVYLLSDADGCSPLLTTRPLPWRRLRQLDGLLMLPRGSFVRLDHALEAVEQILDVEEELRVERCRKQPAALRREHLSNGGEIAVVQSPVQEPVDPLVQYEERGRGQTVGRELVGGRVGADRKEMVQAQD